MSLSYCKDCKERIDRCICEESELPKKLDIREVKTIYVDDVSISGFESKQDIKDLVNKINELIDYLQAKEEASKSSWHTFWSDSKKCVCCNKTLKELEKSKEASKGECKGTPCEHCEYPNSSCMICHPMQSNPPEHEESWEQGFDKKFTVRTVGVNSNAIKQYFEAIKDYIRDNFISKKKIIYEIEECSNYHDPEQVLKNELLESLGLGD